MLKMCQWYKRDEKGRKDCIKTTWQACIEKRIPHDCEKTLITGRMDFESIPCSERLGNMGTLCECAPVPLSYYMKEVLKKDKK